MLLKKQISRNISDLRLEIKLPTYHDFNCKVDQKMSNLEKTVFKINSDSLDREDDEIELWNDDIINSFNQLKKDDSFKNLSDEELFHYSICDLLHEEILINYDTDYGE